MRVHAFYALSTLACLFGLLAITRRNPIHSALMLVLSLISLAGVYLALGAAFLAMAQVFVYAGAIMVLFIFVIMMVGGVPAGVGVRGREGYLWGAGSIVLVAAGFAAALAARKGGVLAMRDLSVRELAAALIGTRGEYGVHAFAFELGSLLVLVAIVAAVLLTRKRQ